MSIPGQISTNIDEILKETSKVWSYALAVFGSRKSEEELDLTSIKEINELAKENIKKHRSTIISLWETFTTDRDDLVKNLLAKKETSFAYLAGFHMGNIARTLSTIKRASDRHTHFADATKGKHIHMYDIACGTGASSIAFTKALKRNYTRSFTYYLTDTSSKLLDIARFQLEDLSPSSNILAQKKMIEDVNVGHFEPKPGLNIYSLGYVWNELSKNKKGRQKLEKIFTQISKSEHPCLLHIAEPANEQQARGAMELRNTICEMGFDVLYPCSHLEYCPLLDEGRDWCYSEYEWERPYLQKFVDTMLDVKRTTLGTASFMFANKNLGMEIKYGKQDVIVGKPTVSKEKSSKIQLLLCTKDGAKKVGPFNRNPSILKGHIFEPNQKNRFN